MSDKNNPTVKPTTNGTTTTGTTTTNPTFPATKAQLYGATRPTYRPQTHHNRRRSSHSCCCTLCCYLLLLLIFILLLLGIAGTVLYFFFHPHTPSFSVTSLKLTPSVFNLTLSATNPNNKITFNYAPISVSILDGDVVIGDGTIPSFEHGTRNTTMLKASVVRSVKKKSGVFAVKFETKVEAKMGLFKTPHVGIRVFCDGVSVAREKVAMVSSSEDDNCEVNVRFKVWKWTLG